MAGSQLKRLKASLREQGIIGPQQSKRQRAQDQPAKNEKRLQRSTARAQIKEQFNPFDLKHNARGPKFDVTTNRRPSGNAAKGINGRPAAAKSIGEEQRRQTLLVEMQRRNKVGGILDRRFGENDPTMAVEDKMLERFAREKQRSHKRSSIFDLEEYDASEELTHGGKSLTFGDSELVDDFDEGELQGLLGDEDTSMINEQRLKRMRNMNEDEDEDANDEPERKKTKKEVMSELIAKSKFHKYERQAAKDDDDELRKELDKELRDVRNLLYAGSKGFPLDGLKERDHPTPLIAGVEKAAFEKDFDLRLRQMVQDKRAQPTTRTKTDEEKAEEESTRLRELEENRLKRMRGEVVSEDDESEDEDEAEDKVAEDTPAFQFLDLEEQEDWGLGKGIKTRPTATQLGFDDEDDFIVESDLIASGSDLEPLDDSSEQENEDDSEDEDEFTKGLLNEEEAKSSLFDKTNTKGTIDVKDDVTELPYTFPCPQSLEELTKLAQQYPIEKLPTIVQRLRALYHPKLNSKNKEKLSNFSMALVDYIAKAREPSEQPPFQVMENLVRHIHSLAKMFPIDIAKQFRTHIEEIGRLRPLSIHLGDLVLFAAIGSIFPTSDNFHQVGTPAGLSMARYLGQKVPQTLDEYATGVFLSTLAVQYQQLSKRYVPEVINFCLNTLCALAPVAPASGLGLFPIHEPTPEIRITNARDVRLRKISIADCSRTEQTTAKAESLKIALTDVTVQVLEAAADTWTGKSAFFETFEPTLKILKHLNNKACRSKLPDTLLERIEKAISKFERMLKIAHLSRRPLELHHHRPLAIKTYIPKFEGENFDPTKHYDPDRDRAELAKLKAEHKKERKGAVRELRKDARFMARETLRVKKSKDEAYEKKYKRLVAEIQSEEGREANAYEREKAGRKRERQR